MAALKEKGYLRIFFVFQCKLVGPRSTVTWRALCQGLQTWANNWAKGIISEGYLIRDSVKIQLEVAEEMFLWKCWRTTYHWRGTKADHVVLKWAKNYNNYKNVLMKFATHSKNIFCILKRCTCFDFNNIKYILTNIFQQSLS